MKNDLKVSICIPCYNSEKFLDKLFKNLNQIDFKDKEILFLNDGSNDNTLLKLKENIKKYKLEKNSRIINQSNKGLAECRNILIKHAAAPYIFFLDHDDFIPKKAINKLYEIAVKGQYDIVTGRTIVIFRKFFYFPFLVSYRYTKKITSQHYVKSNISTCWASLMKKDIFKNDKFLSGYSYEDIGLMNYIFLKTPNFKSTRHIVYYYSRFRSNKVRTLSQFSDQNKWKLIDLFEQTNYAFKNYNKQNWLKNKEYKRYINGTLFQIMVVCYKLSKFYSYNKNIRKLPLIAFLYFLKKNDMQLKYSKTFWKSFAYFYLKTIYNKSQKIISTNNMIFNNKIFYLKDLSEIKNKKSFIYYCPKFNDLNVFSKYKRPTFLVPIKENEIVKNDSCSKNILWGIKPDKIKQEILRYKKIYFIDLSHFKQFSQNELTLINKIDKRLLLLLNPNLVSKYQLNDINHVCCK